MTALAIPFLPAPKIDLVTLRFKVSGPEDRRAPVEVFDADGNMVVVGGFAEIREWLGLLHYRPTIGPNGVWVREG